MSVKWGELQVGRIVGWLELEVGYAYHSFRTSPSHTSLGVTKENSSKPLRRTLWTQKGGVQACWWDCKVREKTEKTEAQL